MCLDFRKKRVFLKIRLLFTYLTQYLYVRIFFSLLQQQVFGPSDTVSLKNKNATYTTAQQQKNT